MLSARPYPDCSVTMILSYIIFVYFTFHKALLCLLITFLDSHQVHIKENHCVINFIKKKGLQEHIDEQ